MPVNFALESNGATVSASAGGGVGFIINGNRAVSNGEYQGPAGAQVVIDFGQIRDINEVAICTQTSGDANIDETATFVQFGLTGARIEAFVSNAWLIVGEYSGNNRKVRRVELEGVTTSKLRVTPIASHDGVMRITEIEVHFNSVVGVLDERAAAFAVALRRLKTNYAGGSLRLIRAGGQEIDISFDNLGLLEKAAALDFAAGAAFLNVPAWYDQSGNNRHAVQADPAKQPRLNLIDFTVDFPAGAFLQAPGVNLTGTDKISHFLKASTSGTNGNYLSFFGHNSYPNNAFYIWREGDPSQNRYGSIETLFNAVENIKISNSQFTPHQRYLFSTVIDRAIVGAGALRFYMDGAEQAGVYVPNNNNGNFADAPLTLGGPIIDCRFTEAIVFPSAVIPAERTAIETSISGARGARIFRITTGSALPAGAVGVPYSAVINTESPRSPITIESYANLPSGLTLAVSGKSIVVSGTPTTAGSYFDFIVYLNNGNEIITKTFSIAIKGVPTSLWSQRQSVPFSDLEAWHALDGATNGAEIGDFARKNRYLVATSNPPVLTADVINGLPGLYFDGTKNPLKHTGNTLFKHAFILASYDGATFVGYEGLLSGIAANPILVGNQGTADFINLTLSQYGEYKYLKNYVSSPETSQSAPVSNRIAIIEIAFPPSLFLDGIQIGQDRTFTNRKWRGYFIESLIYSSIKNDSERQKIYSYFAEKFHLWRQTPMGLNIFPFRNNHKTPSQSFVNELSSTSISGAHKSRSKSGLIRRFDVPFSGRYQSEFDAGEAFWYYNRRQCVFEDNAVYPPISYTGRITTPLERDPQSINNFGYKFGFETSADRAPGGNGFQSNESLDFLYDG